MEEQSSEVAGQIGASFRPDSALPQAPVSLGDIEGFRSYCVIGGFGCTSDGKS